MVRRAFFLATAVMLGACVAAAVGAEQQTGDSGESPPTFVARCDDEGYEQVAPNAWIQTFATTEVTGGIAGLPARSELQVGPGERGTFCVGFHNRTGGTVRPRIRLLNLRAGEGPSDAPLIPDEDDDSPFGAKSWVEFPEIERDIDHGELLWLELAYEVPSDGVAGSYYASVEGLVPPAGSDADASGASAGLSRAVATQVFFNIPGAAARNGRIEDVRAPRVIWWDGLGLGDLPILERLSGRQSAPVRFDWFNTGDYTDVVGGRLVVESDLSRKDVARIDIDGAVVLRESKRGFEARWANDIPLLGRFTPTLEIRGEDGRVDRRELDPIWVIPSWWYLLALVVAIAIPVWLRRRSRRRYLELLERVEAAEARGAEDPWADDELDRDDDRF